METPLAGGNTHASIVRIGDTVRRPTGAWTPGIHALLNHLELKGFAAAPRALGIDDRGREILSYVEGDVVWPGHTELIADDESLVDIGHIIRCYHDATASFTNSAFAWSDRGADPSGSREVLCHNDLAAWNLVRAEGRWVFIDWDLAAPGRRGWDVSWALLSLVPLMPGRLPDDGRVGQRLDAFAKGYGALPHAVLDVAVERCLRETLLIRERGARGEQPYARLLAEGHADIWRDAAEHVRRNAAAWLSNRHGGA